MASMSEQGEIKALCLIDALIKKFKIEDFFKLYRYKLIFSTISKS